MTAGGPVAVQLRTGPVHLAFPVTDARLIAVCGAHFGSASVVPPAAWEADDARVCAACDDAAGRAVSVRQLRAIAGV